MRRGAPRRRRLALTAVVLAVIALAVLPFTGAFSSAGSSAGSTAVSRPVRPPVPRPVARVVPSPAAMAQSEAVAWIAGQVSGAAIIGCYPAMCTALQAQGISASRLVALGPGLAGVRTADVIATASPAGQGLAGQYAPAIIASFGSGTARIEIRAVLPGGAAAYRSAWRADLHARQDAGVQLLANPHLRFSAADAARLRAGQVDARVLATLAALSSQFTLRVTTFADSSPGAPLLFRQFTVAGASARPAAATLAAAQAMVGAQENPYLPARSVIVHPGTGQAGLLIEFASPSPLGLLSAVLTADVRWPDR